MASPPLAISFVPLPSLTIYRALPILPIIAPGSISVKPRANTIFSAQVPTTTLNFSRSHDPSSPLVGSSVYTVNFAEVNGVGAAFNGYSGPSSRAKGLIYSTVYGGQVLSPDSPCGPNCTFNQTFNGPAYQCRDIDYTKPDPSNPFCQKDCTQYFSTPTRNAFDIEWYTAKNSTGGTCKDCSGEAWQDGKLWVGYQYLPPQYRTQSGDPPVNTTPIADTALEKHIFVCQSYNATYNLQITYIDFQQSIIGELQYVYFSGPIFFLKKKLLIVAFRFLNPINYSIEAFQAAQGLSSYAGYAVHQQLYQILSGNIGLNGRMIPIDSTGLGGTQLVEQLPFPQPNLTNADNRPGKIGIQKPVRNLRAAIEQLHFNITVGMLTIPHLIYLQNETTAAYVTTFENKWSYNWVPLVAVYGGCALLNILAILIGAAAIVHNDGLGVGRTGFLRMLMTSRNHTLDTIVGSRGRGDDNTQEEIEDVKVRFGELRDARTGSGSGCVAFGVEGEVLELRKR